MARAQTPNNVDLLYFRGTGVNDGVELSWATGSELNTAGFKVMRADGAGPADPPTDNQFVWQTQMGNQGFIPAEGSVTSGATYAVQDTTTTSGSGYWYRLVEVETSNTEVVHEQLYVTAGATPTPTPQQINTSTPSSSMATATPGTQATATPSPTATATAVLQANDNEPTVTPSRQALPSATTAFPTETATTAVSQSTDPTPTLFAFPTDTDDNVAEAADLTGTVVAQNGYPGPDETPIQLTAPAPENAETAYPGATPSEQEPVSPVDVFGGEDGPRGIGEDNAEELPPTLDDEQASQETGGSQTLLLWTGFIGALLVFAGGVFGSILVFTRKRNS